VLVWMLNEWMVILSPSILSSVVRGGPPVDPT
jgi:hypothetical protein